MPFHAPYNFVPLSAWVYQPPWASKITHDLPFKDGLSGSFDITITARTPILCGGGTSTMSAPYNGQNYDFKAVEFFSNPDGKPAIPGSTLRGMVRNVLEIAAFGQMKFIDGNRRFGLRDLRGQKPLYQDRLVRKEGHNPTHVYPLSKPGFLRYVPGDPSAPWQIIPCNVARIDFEQIAAITGTPPAAWQQREDVVTRYERFLLSGKPLTQELHVSEETAHAHQGGTLRIHYRDACVAHAHWPLHDGTVVLTGKPQRGIENHAKKLEFFFFDPRPALAICIPSDVFDGFLAIHSPTDKPEDWNPNWRYWFEKLQHDPETQIPIFFIGAPGKVESFGLAMMFKLAHTRSVGDILNNSRRRNQSSSDHKNEMLVDLPTAIFGAARDQQNDTARVDASVGAGLKGRVSFSAATLSHELQPISVGPVALMAPKPQFYPTYIRQPRQQGGNLDGDLYASYTVPNGNYLREVRQPELAGWKVFPARGAYGPIPALPEPVNNPTEVFRGLKPLPAGAQFAGSVRFHNLRPIELGALLWTLTWGGRNELCHRVGMGKPFGLGNVSISVTWAPDRITPNETGAAVQTETQLIECFIDEMEREYHAASTNLSWRNSEQLKTLLAAASPAVAVGRSLTYMNVEQHRDGREGGYILPRYLATNENPPNDMRAFRRPDPPAPVVPAMFAVGDSVVDTSTSAHVVIVEVLPGRRYLIEFADGDTEEVPETQLSRH